MARFASFVLALVVASVVLTFAGVTGEVLDGAYAFTQLFPEVVAIGSLLGIAVVATLAINFLVQIVNRGFNFVMIPLRPYKVSFVRR